MPNFKSHMYEKTYQDLKANSFQGWGGEIYSARMAEWALTIRELLANSHFPKAPAKLLEIGCCSGDVTLQFVNYPLFERTITEWNLPSWRHLQKIEAGKNITVATPGSLLRSIKLKYLIY